jgi:hypothetical protein
MPMMAQYDPSILARAQENMRLQQEYGMRPGDPSFSSKAEADAFHARLDASEAAATARDAAANGGLGEAWISNPGGNPINYSNYKPPVNVPGSNVTYGPAGTGAPPMRTSAPGYPAAPAGGAGGAGGANGGLQFANGTNLAPGQPIVPPGQGGANYALDPSKYLDPSMAFTMAEGLRGLGSTASAGGQTFAGNTLRDILKYSQGVAGQNWNNAAQLAAQQQGFGRNIDVNNRDFTQAQNVNDRDFAYKAQTEDQLNAWNQNYQQQALGIQAAQGQNQLASIIAQLQNSNIMKGGETQGAGTLGQNAAGTDAISQIIAMMTGGSYANNLPQFRP